MITEQLVWRLHDFICSIIDMHEANGRDVIPEPECAQVYLTRSILCWVLGHDVQFEDTMSRLEEELAQAGFRLTPEQIDEKEKRNAN